MENRKTVLYFNTLEQLVNLGLPPQFVTLLILLIVIAALIVSFIAPDQKVKRQ